MQISLIQLHKLKNLLLKINDSVTLKEEFETFQLIIIIKKNIYKKISSIVFNAVKNEKNYLIKSKLKQSKQEKDLWK